MGRENYLGTATLAIDPANTAYWSHVGMVVRKVYKVHCIQCIQTRLGLCDSI